MQLRAEAGAWRQAHAFFVQSLRARSRRSPRPGPSADGSSASSASSRIRRRWPQAEASLRQALALDPDNGAAQYYYAQLEIDLGRVGDSLARLLERAWQRRAEPHIYAGAGARLPLRRPARRLGRRAPRRRPARSRRCRPACCTPTTCRATSSGRSTSCTAAAIRSRRGCSARWAGATRPSPRPGAKKTRFAAMPLLRGFATGMRAGAGGRPRRGAGGDAAVRDRRFSDGEMLVLRGRGPTPCSATAERAFAILNRAVDAGFLCAAGLRARRLPGAAARERRVGAARGPAHRGAGGRWRASSIAAAGRALLGL